MIDHEKLEAALSELPLYTYQFISPDDLEFSVRSDQENDTAKRQKPVPLYHFPFPSFFSSEKLLRCVFCLHSIVRKSANPTTFNMSMTVGATFFTISSPSFRSIFF